MLYELVLDLAQHSRNTSKENKTDDLNMVKFYFCIEQRQAFQGWYGGFMKLSEIQDPSSLCSIIFREFPISMWSQMVDGDLVIISMFLKEDGLNKWKDTSIPFSKVFPEVPHNIST